MPRTSPSAIAADVPGTRSSPSALRAGSGTLRDPRLWLGVILVATSALLGGRILAAADDTITVWSVARDVPEGASVDAEDVVPAAVHFANVANAKGYLLADQSLPAGARAAHRLSAGELLTEQGLDPPGGAAPELPLGVDASDLPADLAPGEAVSVWAVPAQGTRRNRVEMVLERATVLAISSPGAGDLGSARTVLLGADSLVVVGAALRALSGSRPVLVRTDG